MTGHRDTEKHLSQIPALHLLQKLGYRMLSKPDLDRERRGKLGNVLLEDILRTQLAKLNRIEHRGTSHHFTEASIETAVERVRGHGPQGLLRTNEAVTDLLQLGTALNQTIEGETRGRSLKYVDWSNPAANDFHIAKEFDVARTSSTSTSRPDIVLFVNGIPFAVIECKGPREDLEQGISQQIRNQSAEWVPHLFRSVQLLISTKPDAVKYGTIDTALPFWSIWREREDRAALLHKLVNEPLDEGQSASTFGDGFEDERTPYEAMIGGGRDVTEQDRVLDSLCRPERLLDLARRFMLFDLGTKKVARYQQFFAVKSIIERVKARDGEGRRQGGVVWHTQGSGKSLTMVMLARALAMRPEIASPRILLVTDRVDLDDQLEKTFAACGKSPKRADSGNDLLTAIKDRADLISTTVHKFESAAKNARGYKEESADVFVIVDESHRSQYGEMATHMRRIFPNACYLGFTGTPLMKAEKSTFEKFGGLIDVYAIDQAVKDGAVVPLLYEGRFVERDINRDGIDRWFERTIEGLTDEQKADLKRKFSRNQELSQTEQTIRCIAWDVSRHYQDAFKGTGFKAQLVAPSKRAALLFKAALDEIGTICSDVIISGPDQREGYEEVNDDPREEVQRFWNRMMQRHGNEAAYNKNIIDGFKKRDEPEMLIVVDKLLTGFDAPRNTVLYVAKKLSGHNLLQAIARVNRVEEGKEHGIIIDYAGVLGALDQALTTYGALEGFDEDDVKAAVTAARGDIEALPQRHAELLDVFKAVPNKLDEQALERHLADVDRREDFYERLAAFARVLATALANAEYRNDPTNERRIGTYKKDLRLYQNLRTAVRKRYREEIDFKVYEARIRKLLDTHIHASEVTSLTASVNIFDEKAFKEAVAELSEPASKADAIASMTKRTITERMEEDPVFYAKFSTLIEQAIEDYRQQRISELEFLNRVSEIRANVVRPAHEDVPEPVRGDPMAVSFFHTIQKGLSDAPSASSNAIRDIAADAASTFAAIVKSHAIVNWQTNLGAQNDMRNDLDDYLFDVVREQRGMQLSPALIDDIVETVIQSAMRMSAR